MGRDSAEHGADHAHANQLDDRIMDLRNTQTSPPPPPPPQQPSSAQQQHGATGEAMRGMTPASEQERGHAIHGPSDMPRPATAAALHEAGAATPVTSCLTRAQGGKNVTQAAVPAEAGMQGQEAVAAGPPAPATAPPTMQPVTAVRCTPPYS